MHAQKPGKRLQRHQHLSRRTQYTKVQVNTVEAGIPMLLYSVQVVHRDDWITTDQRPVAMDKITRSLPAKEINRVFPVQSTDQREIVPQHLRATEFQPESMIKIRKRGGPDGLDLRGRPRTGSSMTVPSSIAAPCCDFGDPDPGPVFAIATPPSSQ